VAGDASSTSDGSQARGSCRGGRVSATPRGQGHALCVTPGPCLLLRSVPGRGRGRRGEEEDPVAV